MAGVDCPAACGNGFLAETCERADLNQYWFSRATISAFVEEILVCGGTAALVSSPSVYFSLPDIARARCKVLDYDRQWEADPGYVFYDFNKPEAVPSELRHSFDFVLVDPPFITGEVWSLYAVTARLLAKDGGRILCTTIAENACMMEQLLGLRPALFRPSIPNLVYQYSVYTNYMSQRLDQLNPEVDDEDWRRLATASAPNRTSEDHAHVLQESSKVNTLPPEPFAIDEPKVSAGPPPPGVELLTELREQLGNVKRSFGAVFTPLAAASRGGETSSAAGKATAALAEASAACAGLDAWLQGRDAEIATALGETPEVYAARLRQDRWHTVAIASMIAKAQDEVIPSMHACKEFTLAGKQHAASLFRSSNLILDRLKLLKRGSVSDATAGS